MIDLHTELLDFVCSLATCEHPGDVKDSMHRFWQRMGFDGDGPPMHEVGDLAGEVDDDALRQLGAESGMTDAAERASWNLPSLYKFTGIRHELSGYMGSNGPVDDDPVLAVSAEHAARLVYLRDVVPFGEWGPDAEVSLDGETYDVQVVGVLLRADRRVA